MDYETARNRVLGYVATDVGAPPLSCQGQLRIDVLNANDPPVVAMNPTLNVLENQESGREIGRFSLVDQDVAEGDVVTITITPGTEGFDEVSIVHDPQSQQAVVRARGVANLDYERNPTLRVQFRASDAGGPIQARTAPLSVTGTLLIQLIDGNDPPVFLTPNTTRFIVGENAAPGTPLQGPYLRAQDPEGNDFEFQVVQFDPATQQYFVEDEVAQTCVDADDVAAGGA